MRFPNLKPFVKELSLYTEHEIRGRRVKLIEANHCPGAVMFIIKGKVIEKDVTVVHTGDFRFKDSMLEYFKVKDEEEEEGGPETTKENGETKEGMTPDRSTPKKEKYIEVDYLYLDNTFATYGEEFPA